MASGWRIMLHLNVRLPAPKIYAAHKRQRHAGHAHPGNSINLVDVSLGGWLGGVEVEGEWPGDKVNNRPSPGLCGKSDKCRTFVARF